MNILNFKNEKLSSLLVFTVAFFIPLTFALYTNHAWEDWYITYRASKNLAIGNGLVYTVGERVHSFTSPLGTLVPAFLNFITGNSSDDLVLWLFRLFNCMLLGFTAVILLKIAQKLRLDIWSIVVLFGMFVFDAKTVDFSINGMETALMVFFLSLALYSLMIPLNRPGLIMGISWGGLMWTRPDSFVYIFGLTLGFLIFNPDAVVKQSRTQLIRHYCIAVIVTAVIYTPWLVWAWSYYGSFIPHTIVAKSTANGFLGNFAPSVLNIKLNRTIGAMSSFDQTFLPPYATVFAGWPVHFIIAGKILAWICAFVWMLPFLFSITRALSLSVLVFHGYLNFGTNAIYPWYIPSVTFLSIIIFALLIEQGLYAVRVPVRTINVPIKCNSSFNLLFRSFVIVSVITAFYLTLCAAYQLRIQQMIIEQGNRKQIGLWLHEHASSPNDRVFLECLGYIGFYSNLKMYDYPGMSSPEVVAARRTLHSDSFADLIEYLRPEWLVLRPGEVNVVNEDNSTLLNKIYSAVKIFSVSKQLNSYSVPYGQGYLKYDQSFVVFHRND